MITKKFARALEKLSLSENELDFITIKSMIEVDRLLKYGYIKSKSIDDVAYQIYLNTSEFDSVESAMTQGMVREGINFILEDKLVFNSEKSWLDVAMQILYLVDTFVDIRQLSMLKKDNELMTYFEVTDSSRKLLKEIRKQHVV